MQCPIIIISMIVTLYDVTFILALSFSGYFCVGGWGKRDVHACINVCGRASVCV